MSMFDILKTIICDAVETEIPRMSGKALYIPFNTKVDYAIEEGYRYADIVIHRPTNYTKVYHRRRGNVINVNDITCDNDGEPCIKAGRDYLKWADPWVLLSNHDSGWREDGIGQFLRVHGDLLTGLAGISKWYEVLPSFSNENPKPA